MKMTVITKRMTILIAVSLIIGVNAYEAMAADYYVDNKAYRGIGLVGSETNPFHTITDALDRIPEPPYKGFHTIHVLPGEIYNEENGETFPLQMRANFKLVGESLLGDDGRNEFFPGPYGKYYDKPIIHGGDWLTYYTDDGNGHDNIVTMEVYRGGYSATRIENFVFFINHDVVDQGVGILVSGSSSVTISENFFIGNSHSAIEILDTSKPRVYYNTFLDGKDGDLAWGMTMRDESEPFIVGNYFGCDNGVDFTGTKGGIAYDNQFTSNSGIGGVGVKMKGARPIVILNTISNYDTGIMVLGSGSYGGIDTGDGAALFEGNTIERNNVGVMIWGNAQSDFGGGALGSNGGNIFRENDAYDLKNGTENTIYALNNRWSHSQSKSSAFYWYNYRWYRYSFDWVDYYDIYDDDENSRYGPVLH